MSVWTKTEMQRVRVMMLQYICRQTVLSDFFFSFFFLKNTQLSVMSFECNHWFPTAEVCLHFSVSVREKSSWTHERAVCKYVVL